MKTGVFPGSFDPFHRGHLAVARRALSQGLFDQLIVLIRDNHQKTRFFNLRNSAHMALRSIPSDLEGHIRFVQSTLSICPAKETGADFVIRGIRWFEGRPSQEDIQYEVRWASYRVTCNDPLMRHDVPLIFIPTDEAGSTSSTSFRDAFIQGKSIEVLSSLVPEDTSIMVSRAAQQLPFDRLRVRDPKVVKELNARLSRLLRTPLVVKKHVYSEARL